jgi:hypothetical protein
MCDCLADSNHEHWAEWNYNFADFSNVRIVPNKKQYKEPERLRVHYPLVRSIASGELSGKGFNDFKKDSVLVLCNLAIPLSINDSVKYGWVDKRPDIVCLTSEGKVFVIECKAGTGIANKKDLEKDINSFLTLKLLASSDSIEFKDYLLSSSVDKLKLLYDNRYPRHLLFPSFQDTAKSILKLTTQKQILLWADKVMECIRTDEAYFGFGFDGPIDDRTNQSLKFFRNRFESYIGQRNRLFYFAIQQNGSIDVIAADHIG